ncbi:uncharacterized protein LOC114358105 [Ostrinia furnacalis]|uniref:uncharacterized protein LOC114358105 n=1 Tax=Ostrinia furnacalis TaxID=93504 RepID=UPI00103F7D01|nr:uncharacterized protein LOC114358105 [Ostrinia furnacalis]
MAESQEIIFSQYAQDPLDNFTQQYEEMFSKMPAKVKVEKKNRQKPLKKNGVSSKSFVITKEQRGTKLIQIKILDLAVDQSSRTVSNGADGEEDDSTVLSAQYVVHDPVDEIMDLTETLVKTISKRLCGELY